MVTLLGLGFFLLRFNIFSRTLFHQILTNIPFSMTSTIFLTLSRFISIFASVLFCKQSFQILSRYPHTRNTCLRPCRYVGCCYLDSRLKRSQLQVLHDSHKVKVHMHVKNQEESFLLFVDICFRSRDMSCQSLRNLEKNATRKLNILCPFNKNSDVTAKICIHSIFKSHVIQTFRVRIK